MQLRISFFVLLALAIASCFVARSIAAAEDGQASTAQRLYSPGFDPNDAEAVKYAWMRFKKQYKKQYGSFMEEIRRFSIFRENLARIAQLNEQKHQQKLRQMGIVVDDDEVDAAVYEPTHFADLTFDEIRQKYFMKFSE
jgi:Cathepsin propeptide inhibitor domain (I29)